MKFTMIKRIRTFLPHWAKPGESPGLPWPSRLRLALRRMAGFLGRPGMIAAGVLAVSLAMYFSAIRPTQARLEIAQHRAVSLHRQLELSSRTLNGSEHGPTEQLAAFYQKFPHECSYPHWLERLVSVAENRGINLNEGEYKATHDKVGRLVRFQITLPLMGEYPHIRRFLADLPAELPVMALESVHFERHKVADSNVEAKIRLVLFMERGS